MVRVDELALRFMRSNLIGKRVRLVYTTDPYTKLRAGDEGVVSFVDDMGTMFVNWDSGSSLGLVAGEDSWEMVK